MKLGDPRVVAQGNARCVMKGGRATSQQKSPNNFSAAFHLHSQVAPPKICLLNNPMNPREVVSNLGVWTGLLALTPLPPLSCSESGRQAALHGD